MEQNGEQQLIKSRFKADRCFTGKYGYRIAIPPGETWISKEEIEYFLKHEKIFKHLVADGKFVIKEGDNAVRKETEPEKTMRLRLMEKGQAALKRFKKQPDKVSVEPTPSDTSDTSADLESFTESLKAEASKELSLFSDAVRNKSVELETVFVTKITTAIENEGTKIQLDYIEEFGKSADSSLKQFRKDIKKVVEEASTTALNKFALDIHELTKAKIESLTKTCEAKLNTLDQKIKTKLTKAEKKLKNL